MIEAAMEAIDSSGDNQSSSSLSRNSSFSRLNAQAPEYIPRTTTITTTTTTTPRSVVVTSPLLHVPPPPLYQTYGTGVVVYAKQHQEPEPQRPCADPDQHASSPATARHNHHNSASRDKVLNQVEYYFSDVNLATTDHLIKFISKDPEGFVPISVVASFNKIKSLIGNQHQLAAVLRKSTKLVVSDDGNKVRRQHPLTEVDMEELQSRIIIAENLPEDHSYQNLKRLFSAVGNVKTIRTCLPQNSNGGRAGQPQNSSSGRTSQPLNSNGGHASQAQNSNSGTSVPSRVSKVENMLFSNKLHAFVEYETVEIAEKAVTELNDERNWRSGLRVRLLLKPAPKSGQARGKKFGHEVDGNAEEDDLSSRDQSNNKHSEDQSQSTGFTSYEHAGKQVEDNIHEKEGGARRGRGRGRGKGRGRGQYHNNRGSHVGTPPASSYVHNELSTATKQPPGPRMPDGTRGFTMGRGKPLVSDLP